MSVYSWRRLGKPRETLVTMADLRVEIWTLQIPKATEMLPAGSRRVVLVFLCEKVVNVVLERGVNITVHLPV